MITYNGKDYARVSEVISKFSNFAGIPKEVLERKAGIGTLAHEAINDTIKGDLPLLDQNTTGYFESFTEWVKIARPTWLESEVRYYHDELMITGCIDALAAFELKGEAVLIDFKTSVQESPTWVLQAHLYHLLLESANKSVAPYFLFIKLDKMGLQPRVYKYKFDLMIRQKCVRAVKDFWKDKACLN